MFKGKEHDEPYRSIETHELHVAIFDLSSRALAGYANQLSLITDVQPLNKRGLPGITHEKRAVNVGLRQHLELPWMHVLGRLSAPDTHFAAYAVNAAHPIDFDHVELECYDLGRVHDIVEATVKHPEHPQMDLTTAHLLHSAFRLSTFQRALH